MWQSRLPAINTQRVIRKFSCSRCAYLKPFSVYPVDDNNVDSNQTNTNPIFISVILNDTQIKHSQTHGKHIMHSTSTQNSFFMLKHNISKTNKTQSDASWTPICLFNQKPFNIWLLVVAPFSSITQTLCLKQSIIAKSTSKKYVNLYSLDLYLYAFHYISLSNDIKFEVTL